MLPAITAIAVTTKYKWIHFVAQPMAFVVRFVAVILILPVLDFGRLRTGAHKYKPSVHIFSTTVRCMHR